MLARIQKMRLMDDDFMTVVFSGNNKLTELLLSILLDRNDLRVRQMAERLAVLAFFWRGFGG